MKLSRRLFACLLAVVLCFSASASASATEIETVDSTLPSVMPNENTDVFSKNNSGVMPLSSLSGYGYQRIYKGNHIMIIDCDSSGFGGMGITIKTESSNSYPITVLGAPLEGCGYASEIPRTAMTTNQEIQLHDLAHFSLGRYVIAFDIPDGTPEFDAYVWIYG